MLKKDLLIAGSIIVVLLLVVGIWYQQHARFDPIAWQTRGVGTTEYNHRCRMLDDVLQHHIHVGMRRAEVLAVLGPPNWEKAATTNDSAYIRYNLGTCDDIIPFDDHFLRILLDEQNIVTKSYFSETP